MLIEHTHSVRCRRFIEVVNKVKDHIEDYTVPQYGDYPDDQMTGWEVRDFEREIQKYANRMGRNARGPEEAKRDLLKIIHYAAELYLAQEAGDGRTE